MYHSKLFLIEINNNPNIEGADLLGILTSKELAGKKSQIWTRRENDRLHEAIRKYGEDNEKIAGHVATKSYTEILKQKDKILA